MAKVKSMISKVDAVILEDYAKGLINAPMAEEIFNSARRAGKIVSADPNMKSPGRAYYRGAMVLTPNTKEAERLAGHPDPLRRDRLRQAGTRDSEKDPSQVRDHHPRKRRDGDFPGRKLRPSTLIPTYAREVYDVSGAGDTVISVMTLALVGGRFDRGFSNPRQSRRRRRSR